MVNGVFIFNKQTREITTICIFIDLGNHFSKVSILILKHTFGGLLISDDYYNISHHSICSSLIGTRFILIKLRGLDFYWTSVMLKPEILFSEVF